MGEHPLVGLNTGLVALSGESAYHAALARGPEYPVIWKVDPAEEVHTARERIDRNFVGMEIEV